MELIASYAQHYINRGVWNYHTGIDISMRYHGRVFAYWGGTVCHVGKLRGFGHTICVDHGDSTFSRYAHLGGYRVREGQRVSEGDWIGVVGVVDDLSIHLHLDHTIVNLREYPEHWPGELHEVLALYHNPLDYIHHE